MFTDVLRAAKETTRYIPAQKFSSEVIANILGCS